MFGRVLIEVFHRWGSSTTCFFYLLVFFNYLLIKVSRNSEESVQKSVPKQRRIGAKRCPETARKTPPIHRLLWVNRFWKRLLYKLKLLG